MPNPFDSTAPPLDQCNCYTAKSLVEIALEGALAPAPPMPISQEKLQACLHYIQLVLKNGADYVYALTDEGEGAFLVTAGKRSTATGWAKAARVAAAGKKPSSPAARPVAPAGAPRWQASSNVKSGRGLLQEEEGTPMIGLEMDEAVPMSMAVLLAE